MTTGVPAIDVVVAVAAVLTALGVIWRKGLRPIIHAAQRAEEALPILLSIAEEFRANGGSSLKDALTELARDAKTLSDYAHGFRHEFVNKFAVLEGNHLLLAEKVDGLSDEVAGVKTDVAEVKHIVDRREDPR